MTGEELAGVVAAHGRWLAGEDGGRFADLSRAVLSGADLSGADLSGADVPTIPDVHRRVLEAVESPGCHLDMGSWHQCETTHCRAGWVIHLAGEAGYALERRLGPAAAAAAIYLGSDPTLGRVPDFYASDEAALADMRRLAGAAGGTD